MSSLLLLVTRQDKTLLCFSPRIKSSSPFPQSYSSNSPARNMSIVPVSGQQGTVSDSFPLDLWDPLDNFDLWNPFADAFPFTFPAFFTELFPSPGTQLNWRETPTAHVFKAHLPGVARDEVIVFIDDDRMLQISTENGNFMTRFKLPDNARTDQIQGFTENGMLIVTIGKEAPQRQNVRVVEITE